VNFRVSDNKSRNHVAVNVDGLNFAQSDDDGEGQQDDFDCFDQHDLDNKIDELQNDVMNGDSQSEVVNLTGSSDRSDTESRDGDDVDDKLNREIAAQNDLIAFGIKDLFANSGDWDGRILSLSFPKVVIMVRISPTSFIGC
jgi:hypothetical protein